MSAVKIIVNLLTAYAPLTALTTTSRIVAGVIPQGSALPAVAITEVSSTDNNIPNQGATRHVKSRVQVTVLAANYPSQKTLIGYVRKACADQIGTIAGVSGVTVHTDSKGPDFNDPDAGFYMQSQDFMVGFNEAT